MNFKAVLKAIQKNDSFLISTHINPDIDGLASELVMTLFLMSKGKKVSVVNVDGVLPMHRFLPRVGLVRKLSLKRPHYDAAIIVDCGDLQRIDKVKKLLTPDTTLINIDHHITNDRFGHINLVDVKASSTAEIVFDLLKKAKVKPSKEMAVLLYLGIMTDTGSFKYDNTSSKTHAIVSELMQFPFSVSRFYRKIYETVPVKDLKSFTRLISQFEITHKGKVASLVLYKNALKKFSKEFDMREKIFSLLRTIKGVDVIVIFSESGRNNTRINFRSQEKVDVARLASYFKGGGHKRASGCWVKGSVVQAKQKIFHKISGAL